MSPDWAQREIFQFGTVPACQRLRQHSAYVPAFLAMAGRYFPSKISPWPRPGSYIASVIILMSRQGGHIRSK